VAVLIWQVRSGQRIFRSIFVMPLTVSLTAAGVLWALVYNLDLGVATALTRAVGLDGVEVDLGPLQLRFTDWLSDVGTLDLGFAELSLRGLLFFLLITTMIVPAQIILLPMLPWFRTVGLDQGSWQQFLGIVLVRRPSAWVGPSS